MEKRNLDDILLCDEDKNLTCFTDITEDERKEFVKKLDLETSNKMLLRVAKCLRKLGDDLDIKAKFDNGNITDYKK